MMVVAWFLLLIPLHTGPIASRRDKRAGYSASAGTLSKSFLPHSSRIAKWPMSGEDYGEKSEECSGAAPGIHTLG